MKEGMEILEGEKITVADLVKRLQDGRPIGGAVQEGAKRFERMVGAFLGEFLEMNVFDAIANCLLIPFPA
jgi:hypothetical protein